MLQKNVEWSKAESNTTISFTLLQYREFSPDSRPKLVRMWNCTHFSKMQLIWLINRARWWCTTLQFTSEQVFSLMVHPPTSPGHLLQIPSHLSKLIFLYRWSHLRRKVIVIIALNFALSVSVEQFVFELMAWTDPKGAFVWSVTLDITTFLLLLSSTPPMGLDIWGLNDRHLINANATNLANSLMGHFCSNWTEVSFNYWNRIGWILPFDSPFKHIYYHRQHPHIRLWWNRGGL